LPVQEQKYLFQKEPKRWLALVHHPFKIDFIPANPPCSNCERNGDPLSGDQLPDQYLPTSRSTFSLYSFEKHSQLLKMIWGCG
jgi:hypothetical protein